MRYGIAICILALSLPARAAEIKVDVAANTVLVEGVPGD
jgi:hypothetical protein